MYLAVQSTINMGEALISYKTLRKPAATMTEVFYILNEDGFIPVALTDNLARMVGFRNIIAHDYEGLDYDIVLDALHNKLDDIESFLKEVSQRLFLPENN